MPYRKFPWWYDLIAILTIPIWVPVSIVLGINAIIIRWRDK